MTRFRPDALNPVPEPQVVEERYEIENLRPFRYVVGLDLGKQRDYTALVVDDLHVCERVLYTRTAFEPVALPRKRRRLFMHRLTSLHRYPKGTTYPDINRSVRSVLTQLPARPESTQLVVDGTGVGVAVVDAMREVDLSPIAISITAGRDVNQRSAVNYTVPKMVLASSIDIVLSEDRLDITPSAAASEAFRGELQNFRVKIRATGNETAESWRESDHDDLVLAAALAIWRGETTPQPTRWLTGTEFYREFGWLPFDR